ADGARRLDGVLLVAEQAVAAGYDRNASRYGDRSGAVLVAELLHGLGRRADEVKSAAAHHFVEVRVLGKESITGMDGLGSADLGGADDLLDPKIAIGRFGGADAIRLVGETDVR